MCWLILKAVLEGSAGSSLNHCERYAQLEMVYEDLEYTDVDFLVPERAYVDVDPVKMEELLLQVQRTTQEALGLPLEVHFYGKPYMFMFGYAEPFDDGRVKNAQHALPEMVLM